MRRAGDRGRTGDVQLGKLSWPLRGKGFSTAVAERDNAIWTRRRRYRDFATAISDCALPLRSCPRVRGRLSSDPTRRSHETPSSTCTGDATKERGDLLRQAHRIHLVGSGEALQNNVAARIETDVAGTLRQLAQQRRREDLAAGGFPCDARGEDDAAAVEVVALAHRLARMQPDAHTHRVLRVVRAVSRDPLLNPNRAQKGPASAPEDDHERVADRLHLEATVLCDLSPHDRVVLAQQGEPA